MTTQEIILDLDRRFLALDEELRYMPLRVRQKGLLELLATLLGDEFSVKNINYPADVISDVREHIFSYGRQKAKELKINLA